MTAWDLTTRTSILTSFLVPREGSLFTGVGEERSRGMGLKLGRVSAPCREPLFPHGCEDRDKVPDKTIPGLPRPFLP